MYKTLKTKNYLTACSANFTMIKKILGNFQKDRYAFEILHSNNEIEAEFLIISRTSHTLSVEAKLKNSDDPFVNFLLRINIYIDAQLAEVISYQQEKPVPFFIASPFSQSQDYKYQDNIIITEWLLIIFFNGAFVAKEITLLND